MMVLSRTQILALCLTILISVTYAKSAKKIIHGEFARVREFPHMVSLQKDDSGFCGGSIIDATTILTAAHCLVEENYQKKEGVLVVTGTNDRNDVTANNVFPVVKIFSHPGFSYDTLAHDIAIAKLAKPIPFSARQKPIRLPTSDDLNGERVTAMGWGAISWNEIDKNAQYPRYLQKTGMTVLSMHECKQRMAQQKTYSDSVYPGHICALPKAGSGVCYGDSGSSLTYKGQIIGVASNVIPCAKGYPDFYTRVFYYLPWIKEIMAGDQ